MLNPLQEVLSRSAGPIKSSVRFMGARKITVAFVGQLVTSAGIAALIVAAAVVLSLGFPMGELSSVGLFLGIWAGVMLASTFAIVAIVHQSEREGAASAF